MSDLKFLYAGFVSSIYGLLIVYYFSASREKDKQVFEESGLLLIGGAGYLLMLLYVVPVDQYKDLLFYAFSLINFYIALRIGTKNFLKHVTFIPARFYMSLMFFTVCWVLMGVNRGESFFNIMLPITFIHALILFFTGLMYLLYENYESSMRNLSGILFILLTLVKVFYIFEIGDNHFETIEAIYQMDFGLYILTCFVVIVFEYNHSCMYSKNVDRLMVENIVNMPIGMMQITPSGDIVGMNDIVKEKLGYSDLDFNKSKLPSLYEYSMVNFESQWQEILEVLSKGETYTLEADFFIGGTNEKLEFIMMANLEELVNQQMTMITCLLMNPKKNHTFVSSQKKREGVRIIPNKYKLMELFDDAINIHNMQHFGVILIKISNYDSLIHMVNAHETSTIDQLVIEKLSKLAFAYCVGKMGQDTFELMTYDLVNHDEIHIFTKEIKDVLSHQNFYDNEMNVYSLEYRLGVSMVPEDGKTHRELTRNGTIALAKARSMSPGTIQFYNDRIKDEIINKMQLETKLRDGIISEQLYLEYQPQFNSSDDRIRGFEALVRWRLPDGSILMPTEFISIAEEFEVIDELGEWVLKTAIGQGLKWNKQYKKNWILSVNVSVHQLEHEGFSDLVIKILEDSSYPAHLLEVEVTETKMVESSDRVFLELNNLHNYGVKIAIDDFGTGFSTLDYLSLLPFDLLKIDKSFIDGIDQNDMDHKIVKSIVDLVGNMELESIAEGVETKEQLAFIKNTKCDYIQGFVYSKPMSKEAVMDLIHESI